MSRPRIVLVSGWAHPAETLQPLADKLSDALAATVLPASDDLVRVLQANAAPCLLLGWSLGGMKALEAALHFPGKVSGLVLVSATARFCREQDYPCGVDRSEVRAMARALRQTPGDVLTRFMETAARPVEEPAASIRSKVADAMARGADRLKAGLAYLLDTDLRMALESLHQPVLLLHGREDAIIPWQASQHLANLLRNSRLVLLDGLGHDLPIRCPQPVAEQVIAFAQALHESRPAQ
ncbi:MAG: alpha/beta fold hydrolase [Verrucomicrobiota bacterium]